MAETEVFFEPLIADIVVSEDDSQDIPFHFTVAGTGVDADILGWTGTLSIGSDDDTSLVPPKTFTGTGLAAGLIIIDMAGFDVPKGSHKYDLRMIDTVSGDSPARVWVKGSFKVKPRIN